MKYKFRRFSVLLVNTINEKQIYENIEINIAMHGSNELCLGRHTPT